MAIDTALRGLYASRQTGLGQPATTVNRAVPIGMEFSPNDGVQNRTGRLDRSRQTDRSRVTTTRDAIANMSGDPFYELFPVVLDMSFGADPALVKTIEDSSASTQPNQVAKFVSSVATRSRPNPSFYTLFNDDGTLTERVSDAFIQTWTLGANAGNLPTITASIQGQYPARFSTAYGKPIELPGIEYIKPGDWTFTVDGTHITADQIDFTLTANTGLSVARTLDQETEYTKVYWARAKHSLAMTVIKGTNVDLIQSYLDSGEAVEVTISQTGGIIRDASPRLGREIEIKMNGTFVSRTASDGDSAGLNVVGFNFESLPSDTDKALEVTVQCENDSLANSLV